ncbi:TolC family protein [Maricaulis sp.]|uniref:TolC family protein n=1 Tax=Maricaulis sp. TaxID=1486257 RepID=UPI001B10FB0B|nr:TolC family protein [Maricaulis sp.]MBO6796447.1 TolC family protein [Maricaulis sp.]
MMNRNSLSALVLVASALAGCATVEPASVAPAVIAQASERSVLDLSASGSLETPQAAVALAMAHNRDIAGDLLETGIAAAELNSQSRPLNPVLEIVSLPGGDHGRVYDVDLRASVMGVIATPWRARQARAVYEAERSDAVLRLIDFSADVQRAWVSVVAAKQRQDLYARILQSAEAALVVAEELDTAGNRAPIALVREQNMLVNIQLEEGAARLAAEQARAELEQVLGMPVALEDLPDQLPAQAMPAAVSTENILEASLLLARSRAEVEAAARAAGLENWASLLDHAEIGLAAEREDREWARGWMAELSLPVFDQGQHRRAAARLRAEQALERHAALVTRIELAWSTASNVHNLASEQASRVEQDLLPASEAMLDQTLLHYNAMQVGVFDLLAAFQTRTRAGLSWVDAREAADLARISLDQLAAGGSPAAAGDAAISMASQSEAGGH